MVDYVLGQPAPRSEDLRLALSRLPVALTGNGLCLVGYSLGGNMLLKFLGEGATPLVRAAASVSAPIDLAEALNYFHVLLQSAWGTRPDAILLRLVQCSQKFLDRALSRQYPIGLDFKPWFEDESSKMRTRVRQNQRLAL